MRSAIQPDSPVDNLAKAAFSTTTLFVTLALTGMALVWANNEFVITEEVFDALDQSSRHALTPDIRFEAVRRASAWGYLIAPIQTGLRIGLVALMIQMMCLIGGIEIAYRRLFRIAAVAFGALLFGSLLQVLWITLQPAEAVTRASLGIVPDSLAAWCTPSAEVPAFVYLLLSQASLTSLLWMMLLNWGLRETGRLRRADAAIVTASTWLALSALKVGATLFARVLVS